MKRMIISILMTAILLTSLAVPAFAAGTGYTDANGDGFCDNRSSRICFEDADGDGICDHRGQGRGQGFGLCRRDDNGTLFPCNRNEDRPRGQHRGNCSGDNFVDEDDDGICNNRGQGRGNGNGQGRQRGKNR